jgi:hypothetical protein
MAVQPNALMPPSYGDLVQTTLRDLGRGRFTDLSSALQKHTAMKQIFRKNRVEFESGYGFQWDVKVGQSGAAANVGIGASDNVNDIDTMVQATADWRFSTTNYGLEQRVVDMNREPSRIVSFILSKRLDALISLAELMETNFWGPPVAASDPLTPYGINMWLTKNATQGFNSGGPAGFSSLGLNWTTYPAWQNWTDQYVAVSVDDFIRRARKMCTYIHFEPTVDGIPTFNTGDDWGFYTNYGVIGPLEEQLGAQNDNIGDDVAKYDGKVHLRRMPVNWVPKLDADTTNPFYAINWGEIKTFIHKGWWMRETHVPIYPLQHTVSAHFVDLTYQVVARNRRTSGVIATGTSYPA